LKALVLGHTGFVGAALSRELKALGLSVEGASTAQADLADPAAAARVCSSADVVILASALTIDGRRDSVELYEKNLAMAANVARALAGKSPALVVYLSSFTVYGDADGAGLVGEDAPLKPATFYAASKLAGERVLAAAGLPLLTLRLSRVYGPGARDAAYGPTAFVRSIRERGVVELFGDGSEKRDHLYIDDAAKLCARLIADGRRGVYNVAGGESRSFREVADALSRVSEKPFRILTIPRTRPSIPLGPLDTSRLRRDAPLALTAFDDGLRRTIHA
jgi:UDP-glucose 4-epimerase